MSPVVESLMVLQIDYTIADILGGMSRLVGS